MWIDCLGGGNSYSTKEIFLKNKKKSSTGVFPFIFHLNQITNNWYYFLYPTTESTFLWLILYLLRYFILIWEGILTLLILSKNHTDFFTLHPYIGYAIFFSTASSNKKFLDLHIIHHTSFPCEILLASVKNATRSYPISPAFTLSNIFFIIVSITKQIFHPTALSTLLTPNVSNLLTFIPLPLCSRLFSSGWFSNLSISKCL